MVVVILAAGYATRLYPYTLNTPKPLLPVKGKRIIDFILERVASVPDVGRIIVVTNDKFSDRFEEWKAAQSNQAVKILNDGTGSVDERLGAIGDMCFAIDSEGIDDDLLVIAGDNLFTYDLKEQYDFFRETGGQCICVKELDDHDMLKTVGVCELDEHNRVTGFIEKPENPRTNLAVYATYLFRRDALNFIHEYLMEGNKKDAPGFFIEWLYKKTDVYAYFINGECYDIGTVEAYERIQNDFVLV